jgi:hypothetical protein
MRRKNGGKCEMERREEEGTFRDEEEERRVEIGNASGENGRGIGWEWE